MTNTVSLNFIDTIYEIYDGITAVGQAAVKTVNDCSTSICNEGIIHILQKSCQVKSYYQISKTLYAVCNVLRIVADKQFEAVSNTFKLLQEILLSLMVLNNLTIFVDGLKKKSTEWWKNTSNALRMTASVLDCALIAERYMGVNIPVYTSVRKSMLESEFVKNADSPLLVNLINKPKDLVILMDSVLNIGVTTVQFCNGGDERKKALAPKSVLNYLGNIGKVLLISLGASYYMTIAFRVMALAICAIALVKQVVFD